MKRIVLIAMLLGVFVVGPAQAVNYVAFEQITVADTAIGFTTATIIAGGGHMQATRAECRVETAQIRFAYDGSTPTASVGALLEVGDVFVLSGNDLLQSFRAIRTVGSGQLNCHYLG